MGLLDAFKRGKRKTNVPAQGWDAISTEFRRLYPDQDNPKHYGTIISWDFGGNDPLRGISAYDAGDSWHFVTYGLTELYEKKSDDPETSGYGMEFTFRLKKGCYRDDEDEIRCVCGILQSIARITFTNGELFMPYEYIYTGQTTGIDSEQKSELTGFITIPDSVARTIMTPNGKVEFVELIGVKDSELRQILDKKTTARQLYESLGSDMTDYSR